MCIIIFSVISSPQSVAILPQGILNRRDSTTTDDQSSIECDEYQPTSGDKTSVDALLNPCQCLTGAKCIWCRPVEQQQHSNGHFIDHSNGEVAASSTMNTSSINNFINNNLLVTSSTVSSAQT